MFSLTIAHPSLPAEFAFKVTDFCAQLTTLADAGAQQKKTGKTPAKTECHLLDVEKVALTKCFYCIALHLSFTVTGWQR